MAVTQTTRIPISSLSEAQHAQDLSNALIGVTGVVSIDVSSDTLVIAYEPKYIDAEALATFVRRAGYPIDTISVSEDQA